MNFRNAKDFLDSFISFERTMDLSKFDNPMDLKGINRLLLGKGFAKGFQNISFVHVAGSKGKGSVSKMIATYLHAAGFLTGLYTSPHMNDVRERIWFNGSMISQNRFSALMKTLKDDFLKNTPKNEISFFDILTAMALQYFVDCNCQFAVMEVGLGGRLDSTNVINAKACVLTKVELEHTNVLGDKIEQILAEQLGILKGDEPLFVGFQMAKYNKIVRETLKNRANTFFVEDEDLDFCNKLTFENLVQMENVKLTALVLKYLLKENFNEQLFLKVFKNFYHEGRFEVVLWKDKTFVLDMAHTVSSVENLMASLKSKFPKRQFRFLISMMNDKDVASMLKLLKTEQAEYFFTNSFKERGCDAEYLKGIFGEGQAIEDLDEAFSKFISTKKDPVFVVTGSHFLVSKISPKLR